MKDLAIGGMSLDGMCEEQVAVVPGEGFGAPGYIRLSYAVSDDVIEKGLERMERFCAKLA